MAQDNKFLLNLVRFILEEGLSERAREKLEQIHPQNKEESREIEYLRAWSYMLDWAWDEANKILAPLVHSVELEPEENGDENDRERRRQRNALCLFYLGNAAVNLGFFEDAARHYTKCLKLLQDRRTQAPQMQPIRVRVRYSLGMTCIERGLYFPAKQYYEEALKLYEELAEPVQSSLKEDLAAIYYGLCDLYRKTGRMLDALEMGRKALDIYDEVENRYMKGRMHNLLGHIYGQLSEFHKASDHFTSALAIATASDSPGMIVLNCCALATLRMREERLKEAMEFCEIAMDSVGRLNNDILSGLAYLSAGQVIQAQAAELQGEQVHGQLEKALLYFERACSFLDKTQAFAKVSEAYGKRAQLLEELDRAQEALTCWNAAFKAQANGMGSDL